MKQFLIIIFLLPALFSMASQTTDITSIDKEATEGNFSNPSDSLVPSILPLNAANVSIAPRVAIPTQDVFAGPCFNGFYAINISLLSAIGSAIRGQMKIMYDNTLLGEEYISGGGYYGTFENILADGRSHIVAFIDSSGNEVLRESIVAPYCEAPPLPEPDITVTHGECYDNYKYDVTVSVTSKTIPLAGTMTVKYDGKEVKVVQLNNSTQPFSSAAISPYAAILPPVINPDTLSLLFTVTADGENHIIEFVFSEGYSFDPVSIKAPQSCEPPPPVICESCPGSFAPIPGKRYVFSAWVKNAEALARGVSTYDDDKCFVRLIFELVGTNDKYTKDIPPSGSIIDGWQRMQETVDIPANAHRMYIELINATDDNEVYFDDVRMFPFNGNMKSYVYDPVTRRLVAELDDENYATIYEYDEEGALIRVKKETERGVMTVREARQGQKRNDEHAKQR